MPTPKLFKFSSKNNESSQSCPVPDDDVPKTAGVTSDVPVSGYSDSFMETWAAVHRESPQTQGTEKALNKIADVQDAVTLAPGEQTMVDTLVVPLKALMDTPQIAQTIQAGVNTFMQVVPSLMTSLDEVAKIHPFISVAVLAFKAVYTLETKRRENDQRVLALYTEMKDMMMVLLQLKNVSDPKQTVPGGQTIEGRLQELCEAIAKDIRNCANACDTYLKKKVLVKIFAGPIWDGRLVKFVGVFSERREELQFALTIHTTVVVDAANLKLDTVNKRTAELNRKMDIMLELFQEFVTPEQKKLATMVEKMGGKAALENEYSMKKLADAEVAFSAPSGSGSRRSGSRPYDLVELQQEIEGNPEEAIEENAEYFNRKFDVQRRQIEDINRSIKRQGDRMIEAITSGPHDRIVDKDIYNIWKYMAWRGSTKSRHFVMALKDYFIEKSIRESGIIKGPDSWTLQYINVGRARNILEAFDDDANGFVTVSEVNNFTRLRPEGWSLPHWIAYWAIGWQIASTEYCEKIEEIFDGMIRLAYEVLPENRKEVNEYIGNVWTGVTTFVQSLKREKGTEGLKSKFEPYVVTEEAKLQRNLEGIKYDIDSYDTVQLIAGEGRVEMTFLPMLYLALKRDLERISLARKYVLSDLEMPDAQETIQYILDAAWYRIGSLRTIFESQNLEAKARFEVFASGLYNIASAGVTFRGDKLRKLPKPTPCRDEMIPNPDSTSLSILNHPLGVKDEIDFAAFDPTEPSFSPEDPTLGAYYGFIYTYKSPTDPMTKYTFSKGEEENTLVATGTHYQRGILKHYVFTGRWSPALEDGKIPMEMKNVNITKWASMELTGVFDPEENSLRGTLVYSSMRTKGEFVFKRDPSLVRFYRAPSVTNARERWDFAITLVLDRIRREAWSPVYILKRIRDGKRYKELSLKTHYGRHPTRDEFRELLCFFPVLYEADARFYTSLIRINLNNTPIFTQRCDNCFAFLGGSRIVCMDCHSDETTTDFCSEQECVDSTVTFYDDRKPHSPHHSMFKVYRIIFDRDMGKIEDAAENAIYSARDTISELKEEGKPMPECIHCKKAVSLPFWRCVECTEMFICDDCEYKQLAFDETHTEMHTIVRVTEGVEEEELSVEDRLRLVEDELGRVKQLLLKLVEKGLEGSSSDPLTKADLQMAAMEIESDRGHLVLEEEAGTKGNA